MTGSRAIDWAVLDVLTAQLGDSGSEIRETLLVTYLQEGAVRMAELRTAVDSNDYSGVQDVAHTLKSSSALLGALTLADLLQQTEDAARVGAPSVAALATLTQVAYGQAAEAITVHLSSAADSH